MYYPTDKDKDSKADIKNADAATDLFGAKINSSTGEPIGVHTSVKIPSMEATFRSHLERYTFDLLDHWDSVKSYEVESLRIPYSYRGKQHIYKPDIIIRFKNGRKKIVELKTKNFIEDGRNKAKFEAADKFAKENGYTFDVWTWKEVKGIKSRNNLHSNIDEIYKYNPDELYKDRNRRQQNTFSQQKYENRISKLYNNQSSNSKSDNMGCSGLIAWVIIIWIILSIINLLIGGL